MNAGVKRYLPGRLQKDKFVTSGPLISTEIQFLENAAAELDCPRGGWSGRRNAEGSTSGVIVCIYSSS